MIEVHDLVCGSFVEDGLYGCRVVGFTVFFLAISSANTRARAAVAILGLSGFQLLRDCLRTLLAGMKPSFFVLIVSASVTATRKLPSLSSLRIRLRS